VYLDDVDRFDADSRAWWTKQIDLAELDGFRRRPRILASTAAPLPTLGADPGFAAGIGRLLLRFAIELPPLRAIREDVPAIAESLAERIGASVGRSPRLSPSASAFLAEQRWPGNVTQLERVLERAISYSRGRQIRRELVEEVFAELADSLDTIRERGAVREREELLNALEDSRGNISRAAERLDRSRAAVYRLIEKHGIPIQKGR
jgi:DNA-binding NtrC family response regulator